MGLGMLFGFYAFYNPAELWIDNRIFDLMVQRTYGAMTNDVLISVPLFVLMGYVMERGALVDKMFYSVQLSFRRVPASLAVTTLIVCTFWGIASGLVGAVVVLMGVIAMRGGQLPGGTRDWRRSLIFRLSSPLPAHLRSPSQSPTSLRYGSSAEADRL